MSFSFSLLAKSVLTSLIHFYSLQICARYTEPSWVRGFFLMISWNSWSPIFPRGGSGGQFFMIKCKQLVYGLNVAKLTLMLNLVPCTANRGEGSKILDNKGFSVWPPLHISDSLSNESSHLSSLSSLSCLPYFSLSLSFSHFSHQWICFLRFCNFKKANINNLLHLMKAKTQLNHAISER